MKLGVRTDSLSKYSSLHLYTGISRSKATASTHVNMANPGWLRIFGILLFLIGAHGSPMANLSAFAHALKHSDIGPQSPKLEPRRRHKEGGSITLINATPYDWKRIYMHSYQLDANWPETVPAGMCCHSPAQRVPLTLQYFRHNRRDSCYFQKEP